MDNLEDNSPLSEAKSFLNKTVRVTYPSGVVAIGEFVCLDKEGGVILQDVKLHIKDSVTKYQSTVIVPIEGIKFEVLVA